MKSRRFGNLRLRLGDAATPRAATSLIAFAIAFSPLATAQLVTRVSVTAQGLEGDADSSRASISADGRWVAFQSRAHNLVAGDSNQTDDVFVVDTQSGAITRASVAMGGTDSDAGSDRPSLSSTGRHVAFSSFASNLVLGDTNNRRDVFLRDLQLGSTQRASVGLGGAQANGDSDDPSVSGDGTFVAFHSVATNLVAGDTNGASDIFVRSFGASATTRASVAAGGLQANGDSNYASMSADGRFVVFQSSATNLVGDDLNASHDIFLRDQLTAQTLRLSKNSSGVEANSGSFVPAISGDGNFVAFYSSASNLVVADTNGKFDVFVLSRSSGIIERISVTSIGSESNGDSSFPALSHDGRFTAFQSSATNLVGGDSNAAFDLFLRDRLTATTSRVSVPTGGGQSNGGSFRSELSSDGTRIVFDSAATNLVAVDTNAALDVFIAVANTTCYADVDLDGFGAGAPLISPGGCGQGFSAVDTDCDDTDAAVHPGAAELCNGLDDDCDGVVDEGFIESYCTSGTTVHGCVPQITGEGAPSSIAASGFDIVVSQLDGQRFGAIFYGFYPAAIQWAPFSPSFKCVASPVTRTGVVNSGGTSGQCNGELRVDFNAWMRANPGAIGSPFVAGQVFHAQGWLRDPGAPKQTNLSNGLRFTLCD